MRPRPPDGTRLLRGRDDELAVIDRLVVGAQHGESGVLVVEGPAGFGKTRLLQAGVDLARAAGLGVGFGDAEDGGQAVPMVALL